MKNIFITLITLLSSLMPIGASVIPYTGSRIFWDTSTRITVFSSGGYARIIQLSDGRLMAACEGGGIKIAFSSDNGATWDGATTIVGYWSQMPPCVPDLIQLHDGTIIVAYNPRPSAPYSEDRKFGIRCKRSTDNGVSWSDAIFVNDAQHTFNDGCWEPSMLELPSGELQLYFADEGPYTSNNDQQISLCRSFDGGLTWSEPQKVSYRSGYRDGMPSPVLLNDQSTIVVAIEDNGWPGYGDFFPTTVRCSLEKNWADAFFVDADSEQRKKTLDLNFCSLAKGGAPYLCVLPWGETVLSWQSTYNHGSSLNMLTAVGDANAENFKAMSHPFSIGDGEQALWNSVAVIDTGVVVAVGGIGDKIEMIKGYVISQLRAPYAKPKIDGKLTAKEGYLRPKSNQVMLGGQNGVRSQADFAYDEDSLYVFAKVLDRTPYSNVTQCDGVRLLLDANGTGAENVQEGVYCLFLRLDSTVQAWRGANRTWKKNEAEGINLRVVPSRTNYVMEAAIPWSIFGKATAPVGEPMRLAIEVQDRQASTTLTERIPDAQMNKPYTWMEFRLLPKDGTDGISSITSEDFAKVSINGNTISVKTNKPMKQVATYSIDGTYTDSSTVFGTFATIPFTKNGIAIVKITFEDGTTVIRKVVR